RSTHRSNLKGRIDSRFFRINGGWHALGILISILVGVFAIIMPANLIVRPEFFVGTPLGWLTILIVLLGLVANGVFGWLLKAPTAAGRDLMDHVLGFKMYLEVAEGEELKRMKGPPRRSPHSSTNRICRRRWHSAWSRSGPSALRPCSRYNPRIPSRAGMWAAAGIPTTSVLSPRGSARRFRAPSPHPPRRRDRAPAAGAVVHREGAVVAAEAAAGETAAELKNARISCATSCGSSCSRKCPPTSVTFQR